MNLYKISQSVNSEYDTFDSAVVVASSVAEAMICHPSSGLSKVKVFDYENQTHTKEDWWNAPYGLEEWCLPENVRVELVATNVLHKPAGNVVCSSFNAG